MPNTYHARPRAFNKNSKRGGDRNFRYQRNNRRSSPKSRGQYIDPIKFVRVAQPIEETPYQAEHSFADFEVSELLRRNIEAKGYVKPSPIQDQAIPLGLEGRDVIGIANTGTGKTAAFALPVLNNLLQNSQSKAIIITPTRELAQQIESEMRSIGKGSGIFAALLIGGTPMRPQLRDLQMKPRVIIGTPGRIKDHLERGTLTLSHFNLVVLDEVDRMLDMGFLPDMRHILGQVNDQRQSFFFSATMDQRVKTLIEDFSNEAVTISVKTSDTSRNVHQNVVRFESKEDKIDKLHDTLIKETVAKVIIFDATQRSVERLHKELKSRGFASDAIHGGKTQGQRQKALVKFKQSEIDILVATDVAARGIDVADISHVINYTVPQTYDDYTHRIGRAGRAGKIGHALTFIPS